METHKEVGQERDQGNGIGIPQRIGTGISQGNSLMGPESCKEMGLGSCKKMGSESCKEMGLESHKEMGLKSCKEIRLNLARKWDQETRPKLWNQNQSPHKATQLRRATELLQGVGFLSYHLYTYLPQSNGKAKIPHFQFFR